MNMKRVPHMASNLTFEEQRRVAQVFAVLVTVAHRNAATKRKPKNAAQDKKENRVRRIRGPCFFERTTYHEVIGCTLARNDYHDRQRSTHID